MAQPDPKASGHGRIRLADAEDRRRWSQRFGVSEQELAAIVEEVGDDAAAVEDRIRQGGGAPH